ncbi:MAG: AraC family transcriptional regulator [Cyanobacteria bacterium P01_H01_bin.21]
MATRLVLDHWNDWLEPGSSNDSRLLHADPSDRILVCPSHLGQGYFQEIVLRDDVTLFIHDFTLNQDIIIDAPDESNRLEFAFHLAGKATGYSFLVPYFALRGLAVKSARQRFFKVEIFFKPPALMTYLQAFLERLSSQTYNVAERITRAMYRHQGGGSKLTLAGMLDQLLWGMTSPSQYLFAENILADNLFTEATALAYAARSPMTPTMEQVMGRLLSCPYQGATRRIYLERQVLKLIALRIETMVQPHLNQIDLECIYQAATILREQIAHPPTIEALARQVGTNRLKLNQGFRQVYGTTPYGYLRDCRLGQARRLLMVSDLSVVEVAAAVGYKNRSHFALAFRQTFGINPKSFQMQLWQQAS